MTATDVTTAGLPRRALIRTVDDVDGFRVPVVVSGPDTGRCVIMLDNFRDGVGGFDHDDLYGEVRERLHVAMFRTVVIPADPRLYAKSVVAILDQLRISSGLLVGDRAGGELAWSVAAGHRERFTGLVVIDAGHPRSPDTDGHVRDDECPAVQLDTTALVSDGAAHAVATASRRHVHGDFRLVELAGPRKSRHFTAQLVTEIVVRSLSR